MRTLVRVFAVAMVAAMTSCASAPTDDEIASADYGTAQTLEDCQRAVRAWFQANLKDPESARYEWDAPCQKGYLPGFYDIERGQFPATFGYIQRGQYNAKNSFGGYGNREPFTAVIFNGRVLRISVNYQTYY